MDKHMAAKCSPADSARFQAALDGAVRAAFVLCNESGEHCLVFLDWSDETAGKVISEAKAHGHRTAGVVVLVPNGALKSESLADETSKWACKRALATFVLFCLAEDQAGQLVH
jgi:hypothetical protein